MTEKFIFLARAGQIPRRSCEESGPLPSRNAFHGQDSRTETMKLFGSFHDSTEERVDEMLGLVNSTDKSRDFVVNLSGGQKQRLALGIAILFCALRF